VNLRAYTQPELFDELKSEWNELVQRSTSNRVFSTWEWQQIWWQAYHPGDLWVLTCRDEQGKLLGIAPWFIEDHPRKDDPQKTERMVRSIGCVDVTDYLDIIVDRDHVNAVCNCIADHVDQSRDQFDAVDLCNIPEKSPTREKLIAALESHNFKITVKQQEVCPIIDLPNDFDAYLDSLDKKQRHELRRKLRRAEGAPENVDWYIVGDSHNLDAELNCFFHLMAASGVEKAEFLKDPHHIDFFRKIVPALYQKGWLQLNFLTIGGKVAATYMNFDYDNQILVYNSGLAPSEYGHLSPGIVLLCHNIRHAIETGHSAFDFLRGNESYKYRMGGKDHPVYMLRADK
jgi:CelD/BcsL family acetyltransferase involved in cellulose biosynthesis